MDLHRCRFIPYPPASINALAFSHPSTNARKSTVPSTLRLAVGRANGDIEIWNPLGGAWFHETTLRGGRDRSIEALVWIQDPEDEVSDNVLATGSIGGRLRLFSIADSTVVTEWDLEKGVPMRNVDCNRGVVWCIAAQTPWVGTKAEPNPKEGQFVGQNIVVGCEDGSLVLLSTAGGGLEFSRAIARTATKRARAVSITFKSRNTVITGFSDGFIRAYDIRNGQLIRNMSLGPPGRLGAKDVVVWSVKFLANGMIASGDSTGEVKFWDGKTYSLIQRVKSHVADVTAIESSYEGTTVVSTGVDSRISVLKHMGGGKTGERRRWAKVTHIRPHSHDVKALAVYECKAMSVMASGGVDTAPIILPLREFGHEHHRTLQSLPQDPVLNTAPAKRLLVSWWNNEVRVWKISKLQSSDESSAGVPNHGRKEIARLMLQSDENISSAALSPNGGLLAIATSRETKLFRLAKRKSDPEKLRISKVEAGPTKSLAKTGAKRLTFSPDGKWLALIASDNEVRMVRFLHGVDADKSVEIFPKIANLDRIERVVARQDGPQRGTNQLGSLGNYDRIINRMAFSGDSRIFVTGDLSGYLDSWVLEGQEEEKQEIMDSDDDGSSSTSSEDSEEGRSKEILGERWIRNPSANLIPRLPSASLVLSFRPELATPSLTNGTTITLHPTRHNPHPRSYALPHGEDRLIVLTATHELLEFEVLKGKLSDWSRRNPTSSLPQDFRTVRDRAMGCLWDVSRQPNARERLWLYGGAWVWMFDLAKDFPMSSPNGISPNTASGYESGQAGNKRKRAQDHDEEKRNLTKDTSGAGSKMEAFQQAVSTTRRVRQRIGASAEGATWITPESAHDDASDDEALNAKTDTAALGRARRGLPASSGDDDKECDTGTAEEPETKALVNGTTNQKQKPSWWCTYKYRPILGIVPIGARQDGTDDPIEAVIVERPAWDLDLPSRFAGDKEWGSK